MIELEDRLRRHVRAVGSSLPVSGGGAEQARIRGRQHRRRRRIGTAATLAALVAVGALGAAQLLDPASTVDVAVGTPAGPAGGSSLSWQRVDPVSVLSYTDTLISTETGTLFAVSTTPGELAPGDIGGQALYRSDDGLDWVEVSPSAEMSVLDLTSLDGRLYAVGTAAATAPIDPDGGVGDAVVAWSADGGTTWEQAVLPLDLRELRAATGVAGMAVWSGSVATTPFGVLVSVSVQGHADAESLVAPGTDLSNGWGTTAVGIDVYAEASEKCGAMEGGALAPPIVAPAPTSSADAATPATAVACAGDAPEVAASFTWAELGVSAEVAEVLGGSTRVFLAPDGVRFSPVDLPVDGGRSVAALELFATEDGAVAVASTYGLSSDGSDGRADVFRSTDGRTWSTAPIPGLAWVVDVGTLAGRLAVTGHDLDDSPVLALSVDGSTWTVQRLDEIAGVPSSHEAWITSGDIGPLGFAAGLDVRPATDDQAPVGAVLLHTGDGVTWSVTPAAELVGEPVSSITNVVVGSDAVHATALMPGEAQGTDAQKTVERTILVGTPS